jgi:hypothetical protein
MTAGVRGLGPEKRRKFVANMKVLREERGWTQVQLAREVDANTLLRLRGEVVRRLELEFDPDSQQAARGLRAVEADAIAATLGRTVDSMTQDYPEGDWLPMATGAPRCLVYFIAAEGTEFVKIGKAIDITARLRMLQTGSPFPLRVLALVPGGLAREQALHKRFADSRTIGEWFRRTDELDSVIEEFQALTTNPRLGGASPVA